MPGRSSASWRSHPAFPCESRAGGSTNLGFFSLQSIWHPHNAQSEAREPGLCCASLSSAAGWGNYYAQMLRGLINYVYETL